jgi:hypothetical protein
LLNPWLRQPISPTPTLSAGDAQAFIIVGKVLIAAVAIAEVLRKFRLSEFIIVVLKCFIGIVNIVVLMFNLNYFKTYFRLKNSQNHFHFVSEK